MNNTDLVSIIIPIYNGEKFLKRTINSILEQSYKNIEIILIDDGSIDSTLKIWKEDKRICVYHQENKGVSSARNLGIKNANGDEIIFIDSDDYLNVNMIERLYYYMKKENADISICGVNKVDEKGKLISSISTDKIHIMNKSQAIKEILTTRAFGIGLWNKLIKAQVAKNIIFEENRNINEDKFYLFNTILASDKIVFFDECLYNYVQRDNSLSKSKFGKKNLDILYFSEKIENIIVKGFPEYIKYAKQNSMRDYVYLYRNIIRFGNEELITDAKEIRKKIKLNRKEMTDNFSQKIEIFLICYANIIYLNLLKVYDNTIRKWGK